MTYSSIYKSEEVEIPKELGEENENYYKYLLDRTVDMIMLVNEQNKFVTVNDTLIEVMGYSEDEILGSHPDLIFTDESLERGRCETFKQMNSDKEGSIGHMRAELTTKGGEIIPIEAKYSLLPRTDDGEYNGLAVIARDIRTQKRREEKLQVMSRVLRHNLRNDMGVIQGHAQILSDAEDPTLRQAADKIEGKAEELLQTGTKVRKIQEEIQSTPAVSYDTEITRLVNAVTEKFDSEYKYVEINKNIPDDTIRANTPEAYKTALSEMMENAIEHCPKGVAAEIEVTVTVEDERVYTHVKDVCEPIPKEEIEVIKSGKETDLSHASGLGLWLTNWIVETAGGELIFERYSEENRDGNQITILLENLSEESKAEQ